MATVYRDYDQNALDLQYDNQSASRISRTTWPGTRPKANAPAQR